MSSQNSAEALAEDLRRQLSGLQSHNNQLQHSVASLRSGDAAHEDAHRNSKSEAAGDYPVEDTKAAPAALVSHEEQPSFHSAPKVDGVKRPSASSEKEAVYPTEDPVAEGPKDHTSTPARAPEADAYPTEDAAPATPPALAAHEEEEPAAASTAPAASAEEKREEAADYPTEDAAPPTPAQRHVPATVTPLTAYERRESVVNTNNRRGSRRRSSVTATRSPRKATSTATTPTTSAAKGATSVEPPALAIHAEEEFAPEVPGQPLQAFERRPSTQAALLSPTAAQASPSATPKAEAKTSPRNYPVESPTAPPSQHHGALTASEEAAAHAAAGTPVRQPHNSTSATDYPTEEPTPPLRSTEEEKEKVAPLQQTLAPLVAHDAEAAVSYPTEPDTASAAQATQSKRPLSAVHLPLYDDEEMAPRPAEEQKRSSVHLPLYDDDPDEIAAYPTEEEPRQALEPLTAHDAEEAVEQPTEDNRQWDELDEEPAQEPEEEPRQALEPLTAHDAEEAAAYPTESPVETETREESSRVSRHSSDHQMGSMQDLPVLQQKHDTAVEDDNDRSPDLWIKRKHDTVPQRRLSSLGRKPVITATDLYGVPTPGAVGGSRIRNVADRHRGLSSHKTRPHTAEEGYVSLYADRFGSTTGSGRLNGPAVAATMPPTKKANVDGQLADFVASSLFPASYRVTGHQQQDQQLLTRRGSCEPTVPQLQPPSHGERGVAVSAATAASTAVVPAADSADMQATVPARFELTSADNGDVVERDALAGLEYWNAANPKTTQYAKPSALLEVKEQRDCTLFRRYSRNYEKLVADTARNTGGEAGSSIQTSYKTFKAACEADERKPIHKRSFYAGESVDWKKMLLEQQAEMSTIGRRTQ